MVSFGKILNSPRTTAFGRQRQFQPVWRRIGMIDGTRPASAGGDRLLY
jgi:hypothetical protein